MILADTSVWIDHLGRRGSPLAALLDRDEVLCHPFVVGELACGALKARGVTLGLFETLQMAPLAEHDEVLALIEQHDLMGTGIGWIDAHLLGSTLLAGARLWTLDAPLARAAAKLSVLARPSPRSPVRPARSSARRQHRRRRRFAPSTVLPR